MMSVRRYGRVWARVGCVLLAVLAVGGCGWVGVSVPASSGPVADPPPSNSPMRSTTSRRARALPTVTVKPGDTVYGVARSRSVPVRALINANNLRPPYVLTPGQRLPPPRRHVVGGGETVYGISRRYGVDVTSLVKANGIGPPYMIMVGQVLTLPTAVNSTVAVMPRTGAAPAGGSQPASAGPGPKAKPRTGPRARIATPPPRSGKTFLKPVSGKIISKFGPKPGGLHNDGINIAARRGAPVRAVDHGVVTYAGNELRGFGNLILIRHRDGWVSAYAHNDRLLVERGQKVRRGQPVAKVGSTGNVSRPQLHFELRRRSRAVNPQRYL